MGFLRDQKNNPFLIYIDLNDMCVAIPVKIKSIDGSMADVEIGGVVRKVSLRLTPEAKKDDYVLVHAGFSIHVIDEQEAQETLKLFEQLEWEDPDDS